MTQIAPDPPRFPTGCWLQRYLVATKICRTMPELRQAMFRQLLDEARAAVSPE